MMSLTPAQKFKLTCMAIYAGIIGGIFALAHYFPPPASAPTQAQAHSKAAQKIDAHHKIVESDIVPVDQEKLVGRFVLRDIEKGKEITAKDVSEFDTKSIPQPALAVTFTIDRPEGDAAAIEFQLCLAGKIITKGKPIATSCGERACLITLPMERGKDLTVADAQRALVMSASNQCGGR